MRKTLLALAALALLWIGYLAWPLYDLGKLARAIERRDLPTITKRVDFPRVRASLTQQIVEAYFQRSGTRANPLLQGAAASIADPIVAAIISPEALAELLRVGWPSTLLPEEPPRDAVGISIAGLGTAWELFMASDYGFGRYEATVPVSYAPERAFGVQLRLAKWRWRLSAVRLPERIRRQLADEIVKQMRPPQSP